MSDILTTNEAAKILKIHRRTLYNWLYNGKLTYSRIGRSIRIQRSDIDALLRKTQV